MDRKGNPAIKPPTQTLSCPHDMLGPEPGQQRDQRLHPAVGAALRKFCGGEKGRIGGARGTKNTARTSPTESAGQDSSRLLEAREPVRV